MPSNYTREFLFFCRGDFVEKTKELWSEHKDEIDLLYNEGAAFTFQIAYNHIDMLSILLKFYQEAKLQGNPESPEYKLAKYQLKEILENAVDVHEPSEQIRELVAPYLPAAEDAQSDSDSQDLGEFEDSFSSSAEDIVQAHSVVLDHDEEDLAELGGMMLRERSEEDAHSDASTVAASENVVPDVSDVKLAGALSPVNECEDCPEAYL